MRRRTGFFLGAAALFATLAVAPPTRGVVRDHLRLIGGGRPPALDALGIRDEDGGRPAPSPPPVRLTAADPFPLHLAAALRNAPENAAYDAKTPVSGIRDNRALALAALRDRYDAEPGLHAHILRYLCTGDLRLDRDAEQRILEPERKPYPPAPPRQPPSPETLDLATAAAARGEALEPDNAFFPQTAAAIHLARRDDAAAATALRRAASKPRWDDHTRDEARAVLAYTERQYRDASALTRMASAAALLFPHYAKLRESARVFGGLAVRRELAGDREGGIAIRRDLARVGARMRSDSTNGIGSLVGVAITALAASRPDGAPAPTREHAVGPSPEGDTRTALAPAPHHTTQARYVAYLGRNGHADEAAWFLAEREAGEKMKTIMQHSTDHSVWGLESLARLGATWVAGLLLLHAALWSLGLGGLAHLLARTRRIRAGLPAQRGVRAGLTLAVVAPSLLAGAHQLSELVSAGPGDPTVVGVWTVAVGLSFAPLVLLKHGATWRGFARDAAVSLATVGVLGGLCAMLVASAAGERRLLTSYGALMGCLPSGENGPSLLGPFAPLGVVAAGVLLSPLVLLVALAIRARRGRVPLTVGFVRGIRAAALPAAAALLCLHAVAVAATAVQERRVSGEVVRLIEHEGRYLQSVTGWEWPDPVALPPVR